MTSTGCQGIAAPEAALELQFVFSDRVFNCVVNIEAVLYLGRLPERRGTHLRGNLALYRT